MPAPAGPRHCGQLDDWALAAIGMSIEISRQVIRFRLVLLEIFIFKPESEPPAVAGGLMSDSRNNLRDQPARYRRRF
jgi:hypothetical protein